MHCVDVSTCILASLASFRCAGASGAAGLDREIGVNS